MTFKTFKTAKKTFTAIKKSVFTMMACLAYILLICPDTALSEVRKIVIIPFEINSQKDISYIKDGVFQMLSSRLEWKDNIVVATEKEVDESLAIYSADNSRHPGSGHNSDGGNKKGTDANPETKQGHDIISQIAAHTGSDYVIRGSITEFAEAFSVDATVFDAGQNRFYPFFTQADKPEQIIPGIEILCAKINMDLFKRETSALALIDEDKNRTSLNNIRANPEKLIPQITPTQSEKDKPFWKFWDKEKPEEKKRPFWKFWGKDKDEDDENAIYGDMSENEDSSRQPSSNQIEQEENIVIHTETDAEDQEEDKKPFWKFW
ncbi:MAG: hypothetical protein HQK61_01655 [Desulfamplus sp.]|nr:hypothetical protein [Desulfamplus sp.]